MSVSPDPTGSDPAEPFTESPDMAGPVRVPVLGNVAIALAAAALAVVGAVLVTVLLLFFGGSGHTDQHATQLDVIKTAGTIVVGTGGAAALWLTARRQRTTEIALNQKTDDQAAVDRAFTFQQQQARHAQLRQEQVDADTRADAEARRITEQYGRAADQLGSDKAPVRLAGLYALERLAQDNPSQRPTIVNVICAYLRMPFDLAPDPGRPARRPGVQRPLLTAPQQRRQSSTLTRLTPAEKPTPPAGGPAAEAMQERQVRLTAQRILAHHLRPTHTATTFWPDTALDLTGATLINFNLSQSQVANCRFNGATFIGDAVFIGTSSPPASRSAGRRSPTRPNSTGRHSPATSRSTKRRSPVQPGFIRRCSPPPPPSKGRCSSAPPGSARRIFVMPHGLTGPCSPARASSTRRLSPTGSTSTT